jgi:hypothetical protein
MGPELGPSRVYHFRQDITLDSITLDRFYCSLVLYMPYTLDSTMKMANIHLARHNYIIPRHDIVVDLRIILIY